MRLKEILCAAATVAVTYAVVAGVMLYSPDGEAAPGKTECQIHEAVNSPSGQLVSILGLVGGAIEPVSGTIVLAASAFRNSKCPKPKLMTEEEVQRMIEEALKERK